MTSIHINDERKWVPFDMSPIRPKDVKATLKHSNKNSSPGPDGISYKMLLNLEGCHHVLATLYTKVLILYLK